MAVLIDGILYRDNPYSTRSYSIKPRNIMAYVIDREDMAFIKGERRLENSGLYILVGDALPRSPFKYNIYVGQTTDIRRRLLEHNQKKEFWDTAIVFQMIDEQFNIAQVCLLEYMCIKDLMGCGCVELNENIQVPKEPYMSRADKEKVAEFYKNIKLLINYARFEFFHEREHFHKLYPETYSTTDMVYSEPETEKYDRTEKKGITSRLNKNSGYFNQVNSIDICHEPEIEYGNEEDDYSDINVSVTYTLKENDCCAEVSLTKDGKYRLLPYGNIVPQNMDRFSPEKRNIIDYTDYSIKSDMVFEDLTEIADFVTGRKDAGLFQKNTIYY